LDANNSRRFFTVFDIAYACSLSLQVLLLGHSLLAAAKTLSVDSLIASPYQIFLCLLCIQFLYQYILAIATDDAIRKTFIRLSSRQGDSAHSLQHIFQSILKNFQDVSNYGREIVYGRQENGIDKVTAKKSSSRKSRVNKHTSTSNSSAADGISSSNNGVDDAKTKTAAKIRKIRKK
jgi:hypothetical protein